MDIISSTKLNVSWEPLSKKESRGVVVEYKLQWRLHEHPSSKLLELPATIENYILSGTISYCVLYFFLQYCEIQRHVCILLYIADLIPGTQYDLRVLARTKQGWSNISETQFEWITVTMPSPETNQFTIRNVVDIQVLIVNASLVKVRNAHRNANRKSL